MFQFHHQPFAYCTKYAPFKTAPTADYSAAAPPQLNPATTGPDAHLQDEQNFFTDVASGELPPVTFVKPLGPNNEHPGYADVVTGQQHVAALVAAVHNSKIWKDCVIVITYDENGGRWDHVVPPVRQDGWGVGVRVPAILISPFARRGYIDSTEYETVSILKANRAAFQSRPVICTRRGSEIQRSHAHPKRAGLHPRPRIRSDPQPWTDDRFGPHGKGALPVRGRPFSFSGWPNSLLSQAAIATILARRLKIVLLRLPPEAEHEHRLPACRRASLRPMELVHIGSFRSRRLNA